MATRNNPGDPSVTDREVVISRLIEAPRDVVFEAFTEVRHLSQWWGPTGFSTTTRAFEFREGSSWDFVMHAPDGSDFPNWITWRQIVRPEHIALLHGESADDPDAFESLLTFEDHGDRTRVVMRTVFPTAELRDQAVEEFHAIEGGKQTLGRLAAHVPSIDHEEVRR